MPRCCPTCSRDLAEGQRFCGHCGADSRVGATAAATATSAPDLTSAPAGGDSGRFAAGTVIAGRYRIVGLLGRGGMGEVYRADDLKLARPVALKFLPGSVEQDPSRLNRLLNEVRTALSVSHPNVCRVHDVQQEAGRHFITMEFVDGDDLATLLRRIGRLPSDKALEIARQLCAGLSAAHNAGILHRDLKPANIMIDGRGQVKITDFGLAGIAGGFSNDELRAGTPAYMAPEQLAGEEVTEASDLYALGLVLYEVYTGKPAYQGRTPAEIAENRTSAPTSPSSHITEIDPAVERVILRCLEHDAKLRPGSALAVSAALPGGDPLAAALAAGETPAPQLVAEAGAVGGLSAGKAWALLGGFAILLAVTVLTGRNPVGFARLPKSGVVLQEKAREILASLGYDEPFRDSMYEFVYHQDYLAHLADSDVTGRWTTLAGSQPAAIRFGYRQGPDWLRLASRGTVGDWLNNGSLDLPGALRMHLDPVGRLLWLDVTPPERVDPEGTHREPDWPSLLAAAGFEAMELTVVEPAWLPRRGFEERRAWQGVYPDAPEVEVRIEAAMSAGRPVGFRVVEPWTRAAEAGSPSVINTGPPRGAVGAVVGPILWVSILITMCVLAWRNVGLGRGDKRTAVRFALALTALRLSWYALTHHVGSGEEIDTIQAHLAWSMYRFGMAYVFYLAIEPYARKLCPHMLTSWVRLFDGRFRDPLVGRDLLIGLTLGVGSGAIVGAVGTLTDSTGFAPLRLNFDQQTLESLRGLTGALLGPIVETTAAVMDLFMIVTFLFGFRLILRRDGLTLIPLVAVLVLFSIPDGPGAIALAVIGAVILWVALFRFGLLTILATFVTMELLDTIPLTFDVGAWWATPTWTLGAVILALAFWGFRTSLAGQPVFRDRLLAE